MTKRLWSKLGAVAGGVAAIMAAIAGCAAHDPPRPAAAPAASPVVRGADSGVELRWWVLPDDGDVIARALAAYEKRPTPADGAGRDLWRANGLRLIAVPTADLPALQARFQQLRSQVLLADLRASGLREDELARAAATMAPSAVSQEQWLGEVPRWTDAVRGPRMGPGTGRGTVIKLDSGPLSLGPGRLRLLLRAWSVPLVLGAHSAPAGLRLELVPQFQESAAAPPELGLASSLAVEDEGLVLSRLALGLTLGGDDALLIVPDRPETDWAAIASGDPAPPPVPGVFGPPLPQGATLGEVMLSSEPGAAAVPGTAGTPRSPSKAVIVLVPHVRDRFALLGP